MDSDPPAKPRLPLSERLVLFGALAYLCACFFPWVGLEAAQQPTGFELGAVVLAGHGPMAAMLVWQLAGLVRIGPGLTPSVLLVYRWLVALTALGLAVAWADPRVPSFGIVLATLAFFVHVNGLWRVAQHR